MNNFDATRLAGDAGCSRMEQNNAAGLIDDKTRLVGCSYRAPTVSIDIGTNEDETRVAQEGYAV